MGEATDRLYRNLCDGSFVNVTQAAGVGCPIKGWAATWADYDGLTMTG